MGTVLVGLFHSGKLPAPNGKSVRPSRNKALSCFCCRMWFISGNHQELSGSHRAAMGPTLLPGRLSYGSEEADHRPGLPVLASKVLFQAAVVETEALFLAVKTAKLLLDIVRCRLPKHLRAWPR